MPEFIYAVERREASCWRVVGERVFAAREDAEYFLEKYVADDFSGAAATIDLRVMKYPIDD